MWDILVNNINSLVLALTALVWFKIRAGSKSTDRNYQSFTKQLSRFGGKLANLQIDFTKHCEEDVKNFAILNQKVDMKLDHLNDALERYEKVFNEQVKITTELSKNVALLRQKIDTEDGSGK